MTEELHAFARGTRMGIVTWDRNRDRLRFEYESAWRENAAAFPLSIAMPLTAAEHGDKVVDPFLWGLLPDNDGVLRQWGRRFQVSPRNPFRLLSHVGEECAGAVQFVRPDRARNWLEEPDRGTITWLTEEEVSERIALLLKDHSAWRTGSDTGHFSLAGAQPKTGFHYDPAHERWGIPDGTIPTTHIFKPATGDFDGYVENEHFCLALARKLKLPAASTAVRHCGGIPVIVVERYDRRRTENGGVVRIHQEDMCQALARMPRQKYQSEGGPSPLEIVNLIREYSTDREADETHFVDALALNWLLAATDGHAKNFAFLIAGGGQVRLAPLYDVASALPYPKEILPRKARLAMKIGGHYRLRAIGLREWKKAAAEWRVDPESLIDRIRDLADALPETAKQIAAEMKASGIRHDVVDRLAEAIAVRARQCREILGG